MSKGLTLKKSVLARVAAVAGAAALSISGFAGVANAQNVAEPDYPSAGELSLQSIQGGSETFEFIVNNPEQSLHSSARLVSSVTFGGICYAFASLCS